MDAWKWAVEHQTILLAIVYCVLNVMPRPHPAELPPGPRRLLWTVVDRLCVLTAAGLPGSWKMLLAISPIATAASAPDGAGEPPAPVTPPGAPQPNPPANAPANAPDKPSRDPYDAAAPPRSPERTTKAQE